MAVQTVGIEFNLDTADGLTKLRLFEAKLKELGIVADKVNLSQIGEKMKLSATLASSNIKKLNEQIHDLEKAIDTLVSKRVDKVTPYKELTENLKLFSKATRDQQAETAKLAKEEETLFAKAKKSSEALVAMRVKQNQLEAQATAERIANYAKLYDNLDTQIQKNYNLVEAGLRKVKAREEEAVQRFKEYEDIKQRKIRETQELIANAGRVSALAGITNDPFDRKSRIASASSAFKEDAYSYVRFWQEAITKREASEKEFNSRYKAETKKERDAYVSWWTSAAHQIESAEKEQTDKAIFYKKAEINAKKMADAEYIAWYTSELKKLEDKEAAKPKPQAYTKGLPIPEGSGLSMAGKSSEQIRVAAEETLAYQEKINKLIAEQILKSATERKAIRAQEIKDIQEANSKLNQEELNRLYYHKKFISDLRNLDLAASKLASTESGSKRIALLHSLGKEEEAVRLQSITNIAAIEERKARILKQLGEKQEFALLKDGLSPAEMQAITAKYEKLGQYIINRYKNTSDKVKAEITKIEESSLRVGSIKGYQQQLQNESDKKLALLEAGYAREKAVRERGENSIQAQQATITEKRLKNEETYQKKLASINDLVAKGNITQTRAEERSKNAIKYRQDNIDVLNKEAAALEKTQSAHMNLTSFIGTSMIIWRSYNFVLSQTTSLLQAIPKVGMELDSTVSVLQATMGGSAGAAAGLKALDEEAQRTGINIIALRENWRTFSASTILAGESMQTAWKMFSNVNTVVTALHYSGDKATHIFMALSQMFNKSKVQSEELVKQLGNLLPAAYGVFAKSMNLTTIQLAQQMKKGMVMAHDTLPQFLAEYEEAFKISFARASHSLNAEVGRMQNSFTLLGEAIYKSTEKDMVSAVKSLGKFADAITNNLDTLGKLTQGAIAFGEAIIAWKIWANLGKLKLFGELLWKLKGGLVGMATTAVGLYYLQKYEGLDSTKLSEAIGKVQTFGEKVKDLPKEINIKIDIETDEALISLREAGKTIKDEIAKLQSTLTLKDQIASVPLKDIEGRINLLNEARKLRKETGLNPEDIISLPKFTETVDKATGKTILEQTGTFFGTESDRQKTIKQLEDFAKQQNDLAEKYIEEQTALKAKSIQQLILDDKTLETLQKQHYGAIKDLDERESVRRKDEMDEALKLNASKIDLAKNIIAQYEEALKTATTDKDKDFNKAQLITANETLAKFTTAKLEIEQGYQNDIARIKERSSKKDEELAKKQVELAKKTANDLKAIQETATKDKIREIEKNITTLEENKSELAISSFYDQKIKYLEQEITEKKKLLEVNKELNNQTLKTISVNQTPKDINSLIAAIRGGEARSGAKSYDLYPTGIKGKGGKPASTAKGDMQVLDATYQEMLAKHPEVKEASLESAGKARVLAGEYLLKDLLAYYKDADIAAAAYFSGTGMGTGTKVPVNAAFSKAGVKIGTENPAELAKVVSILKSDTSDRNGQSIAGYLKTFGKNYGNLDSSSLSAETTALKDNSAILEEIAQKEDEISKTKIAQKKEYKSVFEQIASIHAEYKLFTGEVEQGIEEKSAVKYKDLLKSINLELETTNKTQAERNELLKARNEIETIGAIQAKKIADAKAISSLDKEEKSIEKQLATINQMESLNLIDPISAMMRRGDVKTDSLIPSLQKKLTTLQDSLVMKDKKGNVIEKFLPPEQKDAIIARIDEVKGKLLELSATANESFTFTASMVSSAFDTTFRGILDGTIKGKDAFKEFGKSILKTMQELVIKAINSQIVGLMLRGMTALGGSELAGVNKIGDNSFSGNATSPLAMMQQSSNGNIIQFSKGGIPDIGNKFQTFQMANGAAGSLREQGKYEAIMPLKRTANGELGIIAGGGVASNDQRQYNINVNVAGGADETNASDIGHKIAIATMEKIADTRIANASRIGNSQNRTTAFGGR